MDKSSQEISIFAERASQPSAQDSAVWEQRIGLISGGEFGATLGMILADTRKGNVTWSHWEQTERGKLAVFHYLVPKSESNFEVISVVQLDRLFEGVGSPNGAATLPGRDTLANRNPKGSSTIRVKPAYQGSLWLDPVTGTIFRITIEADIKGSVSFRRAALSVEYAPIQIGGVTYVCPVRSLALSDGVPDQANFIADSPSQWLNVTQFTGYHRFGSTTRILQSSGETPPAQHENASDPPLTTSLSPNETSAIEKTSAQPITASPSTDPYSSTVTAPTAPVPAASTTIPTSPPVSVPSVSPQTGSVLQPEAQTGTPIQTIRVDVNRIVVPVVVRSKDGRIVSGLKQEDFTVFDNDMPRPISGFVVEKNPAYEAARTNAAKLEASGDLGKAQRSNAQELPSRITVFLFDDLHLNADELSYAQKSASKALEGLSNSDLAAVVSVSGKVNSGLTHDLVKLREALMALRPLAIFRADVNDCPKVDYYQADLIENKHDDAALQDAINQVIKVCDPRLEPESAAAVAHQTARRTLIAGSQDVRATYFAIGEFVRRMAKMPGERNLVLISSGFLPIEQEARTLESKVIDSATRSNVTISAIDARGLYTASLTASDDLQGRVPNQVANYRRNSMTLAENSMGELADGTGGTFFHNRNDLDVRFKTLTETPETIYLLELSLDDVKMDGSYHRLKVKLDQNGLDLNARRGYVASKPEKSKN